VKGAHKDLEKHILIIESIWHKTGVQLRVMKRVAPALDKDQIRIQETLLEKLAGSLHTVTVKIESAFKHDGSDRPLGIDDLNSLKYAWIKDSLEKSIQELEHWHKCYDPTWFLITLISDSLIDTELVTMRNSGGGETKQLSALTQLRKILHSRAARAAVNVHIALDSADIDLEQGITIPYSDIKTFSRTSVTQNLTRAMIVDTIACTQYTDVAVARAAAEELAKTLRSVEPETFGLLRCQGLVKIRNPETKVLESLHLVFRSPQRSPQETPTTLRAELLNTEKPSLTRRLEMARSLANAVSFIHVCNLVHKNIRPEALLNFPSGTDKDSGGNLYLFGFDGFRNLHNQTLRKGDSAFERNLYRHPSRQGLAVQDNYVMQHDIYSLGVCLLEIGLWESFITYPSDENASPPEPSAPLGLVGPDTKYDFSAWPHETRYGIKSHLLAMARGRLPSSMGDKYTAAVVSCLTCLDRENTDFAREQLQQDDDGVIVGACFIEKILLRLNDISV